MATDTTTINADRALYEELMAMPIAKDIKNCYQCGTCTGTCTVTPYFPEFNPRHFIHLAQVGDMEGLRGKADVVWRCVGCYRCTQLCPRDVNPADVVEAMGALVRKHWPEAAPSYPQKVTEDYAKQLIDTGFLNLPTLHAHALMRAGKLMELFSGAEVSAAKKVVFSERIMTILGIFFGFIRPGRWANVRKAIEKTVKEKNLKAAR